jgi:hypothetical protein
MLPDHAQRLAIAQGLQQVVDGIEAMPNPSSGMGILSSSLMRLRDIQDTSRTQEKRNEIRAVLRSALNEFGAAER